MTMRRWTLRRGERRNRQRGAVAVEFALCTFLLVPLLLGTLDYGYYFWVGLNAAEAARAGARQASRLRTTSAVTACGAGPDWHILIEPTVEGPGPLGAAKAQMQQAGMQTYTTVTLECRTWPSNPVWEVVVEVNFPPAVGFLNTWMPASTQTTGYVRYRSNPVTVP
jgi:hypothetical protein